MPEDDPVTSFFIKFKQNVDTHVASVIQGTLGLPSVVSKHTHSSGQWPEPLPSSVETNTNSRAAGSHDSTSSDHSASSAPPRQTIWSLLPMSTLMDVEAVSESLYQLMWMSFLVDSDYSPLKLRHLPQPVPTDLPEGADASLFGFEDAFEDLLSVTSGQGLMDIHERYAMKKEWRQTYPQGLPPLVWLHQLTRQGLWSGWEARPDFIESIASERWKRWLEEQSNPFKSESQDDEHARDSADQRSTPTAETESSREHPEVEEDMYRLLEQGRAVTRSLQSGFEILRMLGEPASPTSENGPEGVVSEKQHRGTSRPWGLPEGWREDVRVDERTDDDGFTTVSRTRIVYDEKNQPVHTMTETRTSRAASLHSASSGATGASHEDKGSWFWK